MSATHRAWPAALRGESTMIAPLVTVAIFLVLGERWEAILPNHFWSALLFIWIFAMIVAGAIAVVRHADCLAIVLGEPFGTMILTLSVSSIEILTVALV